MAHSDTELEALKGKGRDISISMSRAAAGREPGISIRALPDGNMNEASMSQSAIEAKVAKDGRHAGFDPNEEAELQALKIVESEAENLPSTYGKKRNWVMDKTRLEHVDGDKDEPHWLGYSEKEVKAELRKKESAKFFGPFQDNGVSGIGNQQHYVAGSEEAKLQQEAHDRAISNEQQRDNSQKTSERAAKEKAEWESDDWMADTKKTLMKKAHERQMKRDAGSL